ncbi:Hsp20/alpha crystallin family protein [Streptomyces sp. NPDC055059]
MEWQAYWTRTPLAEFDELINQMGGLIESTVGGAPSTATPTWTPLADVTEADDGYQVGVELPGMKSKDIDVDVSAQELVLSGEIKERERKGILRRGTRHAGRFETGCCFPRKSTPKASMRRYPTACSRSPIPRRRPQSPSHRDHRKQEPSLRPPARLLPRSVWPTASRTLRRHRRRDDQEVVEAGLSSFATMVDKANHLLKAIEQAYGMAQGAPEAVLRRPARSAAPAAGACRSMRSRTSVLSFRR